MTRCEFSDLPVDQCAHCRPPVLAEAIERTGPRFPARYSGQCADCGDGFSEGSLIALAEGHGWVHAKCDP